MIANTFIVKGSVIIERCKTHPSIKLWTEDWDEGKILLQPNEIDTDKYYSFWKDKGEVELAEINFVDSNEELNNWI